MSPKPTIIFAPGAWHTSACFQIVRDQLHERGWSTEAVDYPSVGAEPPTKTLSDDAAAVRAVIQKLADQGKEIVLAVHSYGGLVGANAVEGLGFKLRAKEGKKSGVIMFVYLAAFVVPLGKSVKEMLGGQFLPWMNFDGDYCNPTTPEKIFYHDLDPEGLKKAISQIKHNSAAVFSNPVTYEPWHDIPCTYFFCEDDQALPLPIQKQMAAALGNSFEITTYSSTASHSPFLSKPNEVLHALEQAAKTGQEKNKL